MGPSSSPEPPGPTPAGTEDAISLSEAELDVLFGLADRAIRAGLAGHPAPELDVEDLPPALRRPRGAFVTLEVHGQLNGCIGTLESDEPLAVAVARCAWEAAFADPRLPPLRVEDHPHLDIKVSVLSPLSPVTAHSEGELVDQLRPGVDGLVIAHGRRRATFLPAVWSHLPGPLDFLRHLEQKAGLWPGHWPRGMQAWRYTAVEHRRAAADIAGGKAA